MHLPSFPQGRILSAAAVLLFSWCVAQAQSSPAIQFFLPGGNLPSRQIRFTLRAPNGRTEQLSTDDKGRWPLAGDFAAGDYNLVVESDKRTFERTVMRLRMPRGGINYLPVFLQPMASEALPKAFVDVDAYESKTPANARAAYEQAVKFVSEGKSNEAINEFGHALALYPQHLRALNDLGMLYLKLNRPEDAAAAFSQAISVGARFYPPLLNLSSLRYRQGNFGETVILLNRLLEEQPGLSAERVKYGEALMVSGQLDEAEQQLREALKDAKLDPADRTIAHIRLGQKLSRDERYSASIAELEKAIALSPNSAPARFNLGLNWLLLNKHSDAERELLKAYELGGKSVGQAQLLLGQIYSSQQKYEAALKAFERFLMDMPNDSNAAKVRQTVADLKAKLKK